MAQVDYTAKNTKSNPLYRAWHNMRMRCNNPNVPCYKNYGGRGIKVCNKWRNFERFYQDMLADYKPGLQLDRIDNAGDYKRSNCRWVTLKQNTRNTRRNKWMTFNGETKLMKDWSELSLVKPSTFKNRIYLFGWTLEEAMTIPKGRKK